MVKNRPANAGDLGLIPGLGRSHGEGNSYPPLQHSGLENSMNYTVREVAESDKTERLSVSCNFSCFTVKLPLMSKS